MRPSVLWIIGCSFVTLIAIGLAVKWTEPVELPPTVVVEPEQTAAIGKVTYHGDDVTISRGATALAAHYNRVIADGPATSITFTDDSATEITISGFWEAPDITLEFERMSASPSLIIFSLDTGDGSGNRSVYQYDPTATERLSLIP
jgi:hypothetical protein